MKLTREQRAFVRDTYQEIRDVRQALARRGVPVPRPTELSDYIDDPDDYSSFEQFGDAVAYHVGRLHGMAIAMDGDTDELLEAATLL